MLSVQQFAVAGYDHNLAYVIVDDVSKDAFIVDPSGDMSGVFLEIDAVGLTVKKILLTHTHQDHLDQLGAMLERYPVPVVVHRAGASSVSVANLTLVEEGHVLTLGEVPVTVLFTPGHTTDSVCYYITAEHSVSGVPLLITGDTLFVRGCGRTNTQLVDVLYESLQRLQEVPKSTVIYPGHDYGPTKTSTIGAEGAENKFLLASTKKEFRSLRL